MKNQNRIILGIFLFVLFVCIPFMASIFYYECKWIYDYKLRKDLVILMTIIIEFGIIEFGIIGLGVIFYKEIF